MKKKSYIKVGMVTALIGIVISAFTLYTLYNEANAKIIIPTVACINEEQPNIPTLKEGDIIKETDLVPMEVTKGSLPPYTVINGNELIGNYVTRDYYPYESFYYNSVVTNYPQRLAEKIRYQAIAIPVSLISTVNGEINPDDFVKIDIVLGSSGTGAQDILSTQGLLPTGSATIIESEYLKAVRVVGMYEGDGSDSVAIRDQNGVGTRSNISPSFLIVDVNDIQHPLLMYAKRMGSIEITIIPEAEQEAYRQAWGLSVDPTDVTSTVDEGTLSAIIEENEKNSDISLEEGNQIAVQEIESATGQTDLEIPTSDPETDDIMSQAEPSEEISDNTSIPTETPAIPEPSSIENEENSSLSLDLSEEPIDTAKEDALDETGSLELDLSTPTAQESSEPIENKNVQTPITNTSIGTSQSVIQYKALLQQMPDSYKEGLKDMPNDYITTVSGELLHNIRTATQYE